MCARKIDGRHNVKVENVWQVYCTQSRVQNIANYERWSKRLTQLLCEGVG